MCGHVYHYKPQIWLCLAASTARIGDTPTPIDSGSYSIVHVPAGVHVQHGLDNNWHYPGSW